MTSFRKMAIVGADDLDRLRQKHLSTYNPELRIMARLQEEIDSILNNKGVSTEERLAHVQAAMHRFQSFNIKNLSQRGDVQQTTQPGKVTIMTQPAAPQNIDPSASAIPAEESTGPSTSVGVSDRAESTSDQPPTKNILRSVGKRFKDKASALLEILDGNSETIKWDRKGQLIIDGQKHKGTNITDLVCDLYHPKTSPLQGRDLFQSILVDLNVPSSNISSKSAHENMMRLKDEQQKFHSLHNSPASSISSVSPPHTHSDYRSSSQSKVKSQKGLGLRCPPGKKSKDLFVYKL